MTYSPKHMSDDTTAARQAQVAHNDLASAMYDLGQVITVTGLWSGVGLSAESARKAIRRAAKLLDLPLP